MNPSIAHATLAARFLRVGRPVQRVLLSLSVLCSPFVVNAKENADDIAAPEFSLPGARVELDCQWPPKPDGDAELYVAG